MAALLCASSPWAWAAVYVVGPEDYRQTIADLRPGDTLAMTPGTYRDGLPVHNLAGTAEEPILIAGPTSGEPAVLLGRRGSNVISIVDSSHVTIRDLEIDGQGLPVDAVKAEGHASFAHYIRVQNLKIRNLAREQQIVGISTKCPARGWTISGNVIEGAGTGMYFGDSDGSAPFVGGTIEHNLVSGTIGYSMQIKHQLRRPTDRGLPETRSRTVIRHNVFSKDDRSATGNMARPNVLLGHFPPTGPGSSDRYAVYGNLFHNNPTEKLFQGEGNIALYNNLFVNPAGGAIAIMPHKGDPRRIDIFHNTIVARDTGIWFQKSDRTERALMLGNAVFAGKPFGGSGASSGANLADEYARADEHLRQPFADPGSLDLRPRGGRLTGSIAVPPEVLWDLPDTGRDFDGASRSGNRIGAYEGDGGVPHWVPDVTRKPSSASVARESGETL